MVSPTTTTYITNLKNVIDTCFTSNSIAVGALTTPQTITLYQNIVDEAQSLVGLYKLTEIYKANTDFAACISDFDTYLTTVGGLTPTIYDIV